MPYTCDICGRSFETERGLAIHKARAHGKSKTTSSAGKALTEYMK